MKSGSFAGLLALLLVAGSVFADEDVGLGPWRLGMSKEQVAAIADGVPYKDIADGLETQGGKFQSRKVAVALTFGGSGLATVKLKLYEGNDWNRATNAVLDAYDYFKANYGGANVKEVADNPPRKELDEVLRQTLGTAEDFNKIQAKRGSYNIMTFDMKPLKQPAESRLHCQWIYDGKANSFTVYLYQDLPNAPSRDAEDSSEVRKL